MALSFEWDDVKAATNLKKHGVTFELAARTFFDPLRIERHDDRDAYLEDRFVSIGLVGEVALAVAFTVRGDSIRIVSARKAERHEKASYWKNRQVQT